MDDKLSISKHFTLGDVQFNEWAVRLGIDNSIKDDALVDNAHHLAANVLEPVHAEFGFVNITSWYRCENLEREYSRNSFARWCIKHRLPIREESWQNFLLEKSHHTAQCVTLRHPELDKLFTLLKGLPAFNVLTHKTHWVSVSYGGDNQKRVINA